MKPPSPILLLALVCTLTACKSKEQIKVYRLAKEDAPEPPPAEMPADPHAGLPPAGIPAAPLPPGHPPTQPVNQVTGTTPDNWVAGKVSSMRQASFLAEGNDGATADISLIILPGAAGGALDNINRWRGQLGQPPLDAAGLGQATVKLATAVGEAVVVDLDGLTAGADPLSDGRMVAAIVERPQETWFYKMRGNAALVAAEKEHFLTWVASVQPAASPAEPEAPAEPAPTPAAPPAARNPDLPNWNTPAHWVEAPEKPMRLVTYTMTTPAGATGEVTVVKLSGDGGGSLPNVNRWRGQIGLAPIQADELSAMIEVVPDTTPPISKVALPGTENSTVAAWTLHDGSTWYFKLSGPSAVVEAEKAAFDAFLKSIEFPAK